MAHNKVTLVLIALVACALVAGWQALTVKFNFDGRWNALFYTAAPAELPPSLAFEDIARAREPAGYDGQFYHLVAHDPLLERGFFQFADNPRLRWRRILIPGAAYLLAFGKDRWVDACYILVQLGFVFLGVFWLGTYCVRQGIHPASGLGFLAIPSVLVSIDRMTIDSALAALLVGYVVYAGTLPSWKIYAPLSLAPLARETGLALAAGHALVCLRGRRWKDAALATATSIPFLLWALFVHTSTPQDGTQWLAMPFRGILLRTLDPIQYALTGPWVTLAAVLDYLALVGIWLALAFSFWLAARRNSGVIESCLGVFALGAVCLGKSDIWAGAYEFGRTLSPLLILLGLVAVSSKRYRYLIPLLFVLPRIALQFQPQVLGILR